MVNRELRPLEEWRCASAAGRGRQCGRRPPEGRRGQGPTCGVHLHRRPPAAAATRVATVWHTDNLRCPATCPLTAACPPCCPAAAAAARYKYLKGGRPLCYVFRTGPRPEYTRPLQREGGAGGHQQHVRGSAASHYLRCHSAPLGHSSQPSGSRPTRGGPLPGGAPRPGRRAACPAAPSCTRPGQ